MIRMLSFLLCMATLHDTFHDLLTDACDNRAAADVLYEILTIMVKKGPLSVGRSDEL